MVLSAEDDDDWTPLIGLRRGAVHAALWALICMALFAAVIALAAPLINKMPPAPRAEFILLGGPAAVIGWAMARLLFNRMQEKAGFVSTILSTIAIVAACGASIGAMAIAQQFQPIDPGRAWLIAACAGGAATVDIIYETLADR